MRKLATCGHGIDDAFRNGPVGRLSLNHHEQVLTRHSANQSNQSRDGNNDRKRNGKKENGDKSGNRYEIHRRGLERSLSNSQYGFDDDDQYGCLNTNKGRRDQRNLGIQRIGDA